MPVQGPEGARLKNTATICFPRELQTQREMAAEEGQVIGCHTVESWTEHIQKSNEPGKLVNPRSDRRPFRGFAVSAVLAPFSPYCSS